MAVRNPPALEYLWSKLKELEPESELGGISANKPGYHNSRENLPSNDYSVVDKPDKGGPSDYSAALDWTFPNAQAGDYSTINKYSKRLLASGQDPNDTRLDWMREFFGQSDKDTAVEGWDYRYAEPSTSADTSHDWHIHFSMSRDALTNANMDKLIEVLRGDDTVAISDDDALKIAKKVWTLDGVSQAPDAPQPPHEDPDYATNKNWAAKSYLRRTYESVDQALMNDEAQDAKLDQILAKDATIVVGAELLKQVMLDPVVVETYSKAIADEIVGLRYERAQ